MDATLQRKEKKDLSEEKTSEMRSDGTKPGLGHQEERALRQKKQPVQSSKEDVAQ